jgi:hypothetical protein
VVGFKGGQGITTKLSFSPDGTKLASVDSIYMLNFYSISLLLIRQTPNNLNNFVEFKLYSPLKRAFCGLKIANHRRSLLRRATHAKPFCR